MIMGRHSARRLRHGLSTLALGLALILGGAAASAQVTTLTGPTVFHVDNTGADTADCGSAAAPCLTGAHLWSDVLVKHYDLAGQQIVIVINSGNHPNNFNFSGILRGQYSPRQVVLTGSMSSPTGAMINPPVGDAVSCDHAMFSIGGLILQAGAGGSGDLSVGPGCHVQLLGQIYFHPPAGPGNFITAAGPGAYAELKPPEAGPDANGIQGNGSYWFNGPTQCALSAGDMGEINFNSNGTANLFAVTVGNIVAVSQTAGFACANNTGQIQAEAVGWYGTSTGPRYMIMTGGHIDTYPSSSTAYFPGSAPGNVYPSNGYN